MDHCAMVAIRAMLELLLLFMFLYSSRSEDDTKEEDSDSYTNLERRIKREGRYNDTFKISDDESLWDLFTTEGFAWVDTETTNTNASYYNYSGYNSYEPIRSELYRLAEKYDFVTVEVYGRTYENREMLALHINKQDKDEVVFLNSLIHAREWVVGCVTMNIIHRLLTYNTVDAKLLLNNFHFVIVPVVNPDGYEYTHTKNRMWRKNREPTLDPACKGVDVNRNFMYGFKPYIPGSIKRDDAPCSETYAGLEPVSTRESKALNTLLFRNRHNIRYYIDYHTFGNLWTNAYGADPWLPKNEAQLKRYRDNVEKSFMESLGIKWQTGNVHKVIYECHGILVDHVHYYITPIAFTVEVGSLHDEFTAPDTKIKRYVISQWLALVSQLKLLNSEIKSGQYMRDRTTSWRRTSMRKRTVLYKREEQVPSAKLYYKQTEEMFKNSYPGARL